MAGVLQPDGSWRITDVAWPRSRQWDTPWTIRNGTWQMDEAFRFRGTDWAGLVNPPGTSTFRFNSGPWV